MGIHRACLLIDRVEKVTTPERNHPGNTPPILRIYPLIAHQLANARHLFSSRVAWSKEARGMTGPVGEMPSGARDRAGQGLAAWPCRAVDLGQARPRPANPAGTRPDR